MNVIFLVFLVIAYLTGFSLIHSINTETGCSQYCNISPGNRLRCNVCSSVRTLNSTGYFNSLSDINVTTIVSQEKLTALPANLCEFSYIVNIDFSYNAIDSIDGINCLRFLEALFLVSNKITYLKKDTFVNMIRIRYIVLPYNQISYIEPGFLLNIGDSLRYLGVSHNLLTSVDATNTVSSKQKSFFEINYSYNHISRLVNEDQWQCKYSDNFGTGLLNFTHNRFSEFLNLTYLGFPNIFLLGKLLYYGFDFRWNKWHCDCKFYKFAKRAAPFIGRIHRDIFDIRCNSPAELKNQKVMDLIASHRLDRLICTLTMIERCPPKCHCFYQPSKRRTVINCASTGRTSLPSALPYNRNLVVDLSENSISLLTPKYYFQNISELNLSNNEIREVPDDVFFMLRSAKYIDFTNNKLSIIPRALENINPCNISLGIIRIRCVCEQTWLRIWLASRRECRNDNIVICRTHNGDQNILNMTDDDLGCQIVNRSTFGLNFTFGALLGMVFIFVLAVSGLKFEMYIVARALYKRLKTINIFSSQYTYDIYVSCNAEDDGLRIWLMSCFVPHLDRKGYSVFLPFRDGELGRPREEEMIEITPQCLNYIMFLCDNKEGFYEVWNRQEWKYCWQNYKADINHEIVVVNYDMLKTGDNVGRYEKAFLRLGKHIDFSNRSNNFAEQISDLLQKPSSKPMSNESQNDLNVSMSNCSTELNTTNIENFPPFTVQSEYDESSDYNA